MAEVPADLPGNEVPRPKKGAAPSKNGNGHYEEKPLPIDEHAERCVLCGMMIANEYLERARASLIPDDFFVAKNQVIYKQIQTYHEAGKIVSFGSIKAALECTPGWEGALGGSDYWALVQTSLRNVAEFAGYLEVVKETALYRRHIQVCQESLRRAYHRASSPFELIEQLTDGLKPLAGRAKGLVYEPDSVCMADVEPRQVSWLWPGRIPLGMISLISGDPGFGKSYLGYAIATAVSLGSGFFDAPHWKDTPGDVVLIQAEDPKHETIAPRLIAMKADRKRIHLVQGTRMRDGVSRKFVLDDLITLRAMYEKLPRLRLVVIDPLGSYVGNRSEISTSEMRDVLDPLKTWAEESMVAVLCMIHQNKNEAAKAMHRASGSMAFAAAPRFFYTVGTDPEFPDRNLWACVKTNVAAKPPPLGYKIAETFQWDARVSNATADDVSRFGSQEKAPARQAEVQTRMVQMLEAGPEFQPRLSDALMREGFGKQTIWDAKKYLQRAGVIREMAGDGKKIKLKLCKHDETSDEAPPNAY